MNLLIGFDKKWKTTVKNKLSLNDAMDNKNFQQKQKLFDDALVEYLVQHMKPAKTVEDSGFIKLIHGM